MKILITTTYLFCQESKCFSLREWKFSFKRISKKRKIVLLALYSFHVIYQDHITDDLIISQFTCVNASYQILNWQLKS